TFGYDPDGNLTSVAEQVTTGPGYTVPGAVATGSFTRNYVRTYDARNRLATATDPNGHGVAYSYDAANNLKTFTDAANRQAVYTYDSANRLSTLTTAGGRQIGYTWQPNGLLSNVTYGNGMQRQYGYDHANRVTSIVNTFNASSNEEFDYSYDANSNRTGETRKFNGTVSRTLTYGYDSLNRLTQANYGGSSVVNYGYDAVGNRLTESGTDPSGANVNKTYSYDGLNRLSTMTDAVHAANSLTFSFDLNGNLSSQKDGSGNTRQYTYDALNQMSSASQVTSGSGGGTTQLGSYDYDFQGRRLSKTASGATTSYVYSGINPVNEFGTSGQVVNSYDYGTDLVSAQLGGEGERLYFHDAIGSTTALASGSGGSGGSGSVVARYEYDAWGKQITAPQPSVNRITYTTYQHDDETGLEYAQARYYDSSVGRFSSFDPITEKPERVLGPQEMNYYVYAIENPLRYEDASGEHVFKKFYRGNLYFDETVPTEQEIENAGLFIRGTITNVTDGRKAQFELSDHEGKSLAYQAKWRWDLGAQWAFELIYGESVDHVKVSQLTLWWDLLWDHKVDIGVSVLATLSAVGGRVPTEEELRTGKTYLPREEPAVKASAPSEPEIATGEAPEQPRVPQPTNSGPRIVVKHRGGNIQVDVQGRLYNVPKASGGSVVLPVSDPIGDQLQRVTKEVAEGWSPRDLSQNESRAIARARAEGGNFQVRRLTAQAKGRWVEQQVRNRFPHLRWSRTGADVVDPATGRSYDILSGTRDNIARHAKRMADVLFRLITFD
ncbi:MAG: RHS repeat domain-containing protein, partial [Blastocatellia bacterium]